MKCPHCKKVEPINPQVIIERNTHKRNLERAKRMFNKNINVFIGPRLEKLFKDKIFNHELDKDSVTLHYRNDPWLSSVMRDIGIFDSISQATGAGWHRKADKGFYDEVITVKNRPHRITILKVEIKKELENNK